MKDNHATAIRQPFGLTKKRVLLISSDRAVAEAGLEAASSTRCALQLARTSGEAFRALSEEIEDVAVIILDLDPVIHGLALLQALAMCRQMPPLLAITDLEENHVKPVVQQHGGVTCIAKPIAAEKLASAIQEACASVPPTSRWRCDRWGHLLRGVGDHSPVRQASVGT